MPKRKAEDLHEFIDQVEAQAAAKPRAKRLTIDRAPAVAAAAMVKGKLEAASLGGRNGKGKTGRKPVLDTPAAIANRKRVAKHRAKKAAK